MLIEIQTELREEDHYSFDDPFLLFPVTHSEAWVTSFQRRFQYRSGTQIILDLETQDVVLALEWDGVTQKEVSLDYSTALDLLYTASHTTMTREIHDLFGSD